MNLLEKSSPELLAALFDMPHGISPRRAVYYNDSISMRTHTVKMNNAASRNQVSFF